MFIIFLLIFSLFGLYMVRAQEGTLYPEAQEGTLYPGRTTQGTRLTNPLGEGATFAVVVNNVIKAILGLVGVLALIAFIWGGIEWMTSRGETQKIEKGKNMMLWAVYGLVIIFASYAIITFIFQALGVFK